MPHIALPRSAPVRCLSTTIYGRGALDPGTDDAGCPQYHESHRVYRPDLIGCGLFAQPSVNCSNTLSGCIGSESPSAV